MSDLQASASLVDRSSSKASYADDFHSDRSESSQSRPSSNSSDVHEESDPPAGPVAYSYRDQLRSIRIYAPTMDTDQQDDDHDVDVEWYQQRTSASSALQRRSTISYSSNFEAASRPTSSSTSETPTANGDTNDSQSDSESGASHIRVVSLGELTTASSTSLSLRAEEELRTAAEIASIDATAQALLDKLRTDGRRLQRATSPQTYVHPSLLLIGANPETPAATRLTIERLRVQSLRMAGRLLIDCPTHEPRTCTDCRAESERLALSDRLRALTNRARRDTVARRLEMHAPASVMSRQMLNVAQNARLMSDWMRTGRVPVMRGIT